MEYSDIFWYDAIIGCLVHGPRPRNMFSTNRQFGTWNSRYVGKRAGSRNQLGYEQVYFDGRYIVSHRIIWEMHNGPIPDGMEIDHINGMRSDNRIENMRLATRAENNRNSKPKGSGLKGTFLTKWGKYGAKIIKDRKRIGLGYFDTPELAHAAYCEAAKKYHGEFARTS